MGRRKRSGDDADDDGDDGKEDDDGSIRSSRSNNNRGGISLPAILDSWTRELASLSNDRIAKMLRGGTGDFEHMRVDREDTHEALLACRLDPSPEGEAAGGEAEETLSLQEEEQDEGHNSRVDGKTEEGAARDEAERCLRTVEQRLALLEGRLRKCPLESLRVLRDITKETPVYADPAVMARGHGAGREGTALLQSRGLILTISVYSTSRPGVISQTFEVRAEQHLSDLRDRISCLTDRAMVELREHGTTPKAHLPLPQPRGQGAISHISSCPSSAYFLIEGVFYIDTPSSQADADAEDPSQKVRAWIAADRTRQSHFGQIDTLHAPKMRETRWIDLALRINRPYLAVHCGRCEHYFMVERIRLEHEYDRASLFDPPSDSLSLPPPPASAAVAGGQSSGIREVYRVRRRRRKCRFCEAGRVTWVTVNDRLAPDNPCLYCDTCYRLLHYDRDGRLIYGGYRVYPYFYDIH